MRQVTRNYQKPAYVLKLDIASYFRNIPKERLWGNICTFCAKSTKSIQGTKTRYVPGSSETLLSSRSDSLSLKNPYLDSDLQGNSEERERESL